MEVSYDGTIGAVYIGIVISTCLYGVTCLQFYTYWNKYTDDSTFRRVYIVVVGWLTVSSGYWIPSSWLVLHRRVMSCSSPNSMLLGPRSEALASSRTELGISGAFWVNPIMMRLMAGLIVSETLTSTTVFIYILHSTQALSALTQLAFGMATTVLSWQHWTFDNSRQYRTMLTALNSRPSHSPNFAICTLGDGHVVCEPTEGTDTIRFAEQGILVPMTKLGDPPTHRRVASTDVREVQVPDTHSVISIDLLSELSADFREQTKHAIELSGNNIGRNKDAKDSQEDDDLESIDLGCHPLSTFMFSGYPCYAVLAKVVPQLGGSDTLINFRPFDAVRWCNTAEHSCRYENMEPPVITIRLETLGFEQMGIEARVDQCIQVTNRCQVHTAFSACFRHPPSLGLTDLSLPWLISKHSGIFHGGRLRLDSGCDIRRSDYDLVGFSLYGISTLHGYTYWNRPNQDSLIAKIFVSVQITSKQRLCINEQLETSTTVRLWYQQSNFSLVVLTTKKTQFLLTALTIFGAQVTYQSVLGLAPCDTVDGDRRSICLRLSSIRKMQGGFAFIQLGFGIAMSCLAWVYWDIREMDKHRWISSAWTGSTSLCSIIITYNLSALLASTDMRIHDSKYCGLDKRVSSLLDSYWAAKQYVRIAVNFPLGTCGTSRCGWTLNYWYHRLIMIFQTILAVLNARSRETPDLPVFEEYEFGAAGYKAELNNGMSKVNIEALNQDSSKNIAKRTRNHGLSTTDTHYRNFRNQQR
ncbi:hypothetical protein AG1IA_09038 [Rhizoctonia solani AG-1 IA]|uniref:Uncharacterized protein n=1 Tax=Thanatephorus cucumeris (strain AG1-IA) TaxID=983506 RepID=L8WKN8_THACA|nr:hypothetical protein AG1IA_09038 [Rhizoctonia solani AG-1 IA]